MIDPRDLMRKRMPPIRAVSGLYNRTGLWAYAYGVFRPYMVADRRAEWATSGYEALMFHETLHVHERHALVGALILAVGAVLSAVALTYGDPLMFGVPGSVATLVWMAWRREQEIRADAFALWGVTERTKEGKPTVRGRQKGIAELRAFALLHPHPKGWFWTWCYGKSVEHRVRRARRAAGALFGGYEC